MLNTTPEERARVIGWPINYETAKSRRLAQDVETLLELLRECRTAMDIATGHCGPLGHKPAELARNRLAELIARIDALGYHPKQEGT